MNKNKALLLKYLQVQCRGRDNARKSAIIERALNITEGQLRYYVKSMRKDYIPIGSCNDGYFYPKTAGEVLFASGNLRAMRKGLDAVIYGIEHSLDQVSLE